MYFQVRRLLMKLCCKNKAHLSVVVVFFKCLQADCVVSTTLIPKKTKCCLKEIKLECSDLQVS